MDANKHITVNQAELYKEVYFSHLNTSTPWLKKAVLDAVGQEFYADKPKVDDFIRGVAIAAETAYEALIAKEQKLLVEKTA